MNMTHTIYTIYMIYSNQEPSACNLITMIWNRIHFSRTILNIIFIIYCRSQFVAALGNNVFFINHSLNIFWIELFINNVVSLSVPSILHCYWIYPERSKLKRCRDEINSRCFTPSSKFIFSFIYYNIILILVIS